MRFRRGDRLSDDDRATLGLTRGDRVLAFARLADDVPVAATRTALHGPHGTLSWTDVVHARWNDEEQTLEIDPVPGSPLTETLRLAFVEPGMLPETVHERVMSTIVVSRRIRLSAGGSVRLVARRADGSTDTFWQTVPDRGTDLTDPAAAAEVAATLTRLRSELG